MIAIQMFCPHLNLLVRNRHVNVRNKPRRGNTEKMRIKFSVEHGAHYKAGNGATNAVSS